MAEPGSPAEALIVGGGVAALEALMALRDLAADRVRTQLVAPEPDFVYRPAPEGFADLDVPLDVADTAPVGD